MASQLYASYAQVEQVRSLAAIIGDEALSSVDKMYLDFGQAFEARFVAQGLTEARTISETLELGWDVLSQLPAQELARVSEAELRAHFHGKHDHHG